MTWRLWNHLIGQVKQNVGHSITIPHRLMVSCFTSILLSAKTASVYPKKYMRHPLRFGVFIQSVKRRVQTLGGPFSADFLRCTLIVSVALGRKNRICSLNKAAWSLPYLILLFLHWNVRSSRLLRTIK